MNWFKDLLPFVTSMPDYSKTIIYKIQHISKEDLIYIGATTNFKQRKYQHKSQADRVGQALNFNVPCKHKLYMAIHENGGWEQFKMIEIKKFPCSDKNESDAEEFKCIQSMKSTLNYMLSYSPK